MEGGNATAGIFVTFPAAGISNFNGAVDQVCFDLFTANLKLYCNLGSWYGPPPAGHQRHQQPFQLGRLHKVHLSLLYITPSLFPLTFAKP